MKTRRLLCFIPVLFVAAACTQTVEEEEKYGEIAGIVYDNNVGDPISVAQVKLSPGGNSTVTGTDGSFSFTNIEAGHYTVSVTKKGYSDGSNTVSVIAGRKSDCNILLTRIPAFVTVDKDVLDFGDNNTLNTLSFNIVNSSYENLSWHIDYDKSSSSFIAEVSPGQGTTQYGKTAAIVVIIDREKLNPGQNESTLVVVSDNGDGSSEVKVKAIGQEKRLASLNISETSDIKATSAVLHAVITDKGIPAYTERGFVIGESPMPTKETAMKELPASVTEQNEFSVKVDELNIGKTYYVRAYAINQQGIAYSTNQDKFTTTAVLPSVSILSTTEIQSSSAILNAKITNVGTPEYTERGFVLGDSEMPTKETALKIYSVVKDAHKDYSVRAGDLSLGKTYYVRAYATNAVGIAYSSTMDQFTTVGTLPSVSTLTASDEDRNNKTAVLRGSVVFEGDPPYNERGFVWSTEYENPTIDEFKIIVSGTGAGNFEKRVSFPAVDQTIYVRAFATNQKGTAYGSVVEVFPLEYIALKSHGLGVQKNDISSSYLLWEDANAMCNSSIIGNLNDWRLPSKNELLLLYNLKDEIGGFRSDGHYFTSEKGTGYSWGYFTVRFSDGYLYEGARSNHCYARCVRTLK